MREEWFVCIEIDESRVYNESLLYRVEMIYKHGNTIDVVWLDDDYWPVIRKRKLVSRFSLLGIMIALYELQ